MNKQQGFSVIEGLLIIVIAGIVGFGGWYVWSQNQDEDVPINKISSYEECAAAGYPILESYPEQCAVPDGQTFVRVINNENEQTIEPTFKEIESVPDGWVVYKNDELGITFMHPKNWIVDEPFGNVTDGAIKIFHTSRDSDALSQYDKCEIRGCGYNYYLEFYSWESINNTTAKGGSALGMKSVYSDLREYITDESALKKMTGELSIGGIDAFEVKISDVSEYYGIMLQKDERIIELGFPNVFASEGPDETIKALRNSITAL